MNNNNPIGIFDSGVGGLAIACSIRQKLPHENLLYIADSFYVPYGDKPEEFIVQRATSLVDFLLEKSAKAIVVACNTATVSAVHKLRSTFSIPIIGIEPGVKPATLASKSKVIGVLATAQTLKSSSFNYLISRFSTEVKIEVQPCPGLVEQVEIMELDSDKTSKLLKQYVFPLLEKGADTIVLGCTHYTFLTPLIKKIVGIDVKIIDTPIAVAKQVSRRLKIEGLSTANDKLGYESFWTTGQKATAEKIFSCLWGKTVKVSQM